MAYRVGVDSGGTFTDVVAVDDTGTLVIHKVPSDPNAPAAVLLRGLEGISERLELDLRGFLGQCAMLILGSTVAINALIQHKGATTALLTTAGHEDSIEIRLGHKEDGHRWDFSFPPAAPLVPRFLRLPIHERVLADGTVLTPLDEQRLQSSIDALKKHDVQSVAVSCLWSFLYPQHEERVAELVRAELGDDCFISVSSRVLPRVREYTRTSTTVTNAYVGPALTNYMRDVEDTLATAGFAGRTYYMQSNGGVDTTEILRDRPVAALNSGPAAGPIAALHFARLIGHENLIAIDMGGTSFDICVVKDGLPDVVTDVDVVRYRIGMPIVNVTSIGAGGGSIARVDARGLLTVGPESAEANPGPACYMRGGTLATVTDALVVLGYLPSDALLGGRMPIDAELSRRALKEHVGDPLNMTVADAARGVIEITTHNMVEGIRVASIERGYDPRDFVLVVGGGAGPIFGAALAQELGIGTVVVPRVAGALCAFGEAVADLRYDAVRSYPTRIADIDFDRMNRLLSEMEAEGEAALLRGESGDVRVERVAEMKYVDQVHYCDVTMPEGPFTEESASELAERFHAKHEQLYTYSEPDNEPEILAVRSSAVIERRQQAPATIVEESAAAPAPIRGTRLVLMPGESDPIDVPVLNGAVLQPSMTVTAPAIIEEETTTILVPRGGSVRVDARGFVVLTLTPARRK
jgi:N-methylhydantoinase A